MNPPAGARIRGPDARMILIFALLCSAGLLGNYFKLELFFNFDFLFGSVFVMFAVLRLNPGAAFLVGVIASLGTWIVWNHPLAIVILSTEALFVALLNRRRPGNLVLLDSLYWLCLGMPLVWYCYHHVLHFTPEATILVALKQSVNGVVNATVASITLYAVKLLPAPERRRKEIPFRDLLLNSMIAVTLIPVFVHMVMDIRWSMHYSEHDLVRRVNSVADGARETVTGWVAERRETASAAGPVWDNLPAHLAVIVRNRWSDIVIVDGTGTVLYSTTSRWKTGQHYGRLESGDTIPVSNGIVHWVPGQEPGTSLMKRWRQSLYVRQVDLAPQMPWKIVVESALFPYLDALNHKARDQFLLIWGAILSILVMSSLLSRAITASMERLQQTTNELPVKLAANRKPTWPESGIREIQSLITNFQVVSDALGGSFRDLVTLNQTLEQRVDERTRELRQSEEKYSLIVNTASEGIWVLDQRFVTTFVNRALADMLGYGADAIHGRSITGFIHPDDLEDHEKRARHRLMGMTEQYERLFTRRDGSPIWVLVSASPLYSQETFSGSILMCTDITERKRMEQSLREQSDLLEKEVAIRQQAQESLALKHTQLEALNRSLEDRIQHAVAELRQKDQVLITQNRQAAMGEMIGNIAHQWRQPLNALGLVLSNLHDAHQFGELDEVYLEQAVANGKRLIRKMSDTINDFRDFFRPDKEMTVFSARQQLNEAIALVQSSFGHENIFIHLDSFQDLTLYGFPNEYSQVLLNILSNAREAIRGAGVKPGRVAITLSEKDGQGCVTIRDNGGGIPPDALERIFEPYFSTKPMGTGIGLYMSKMIVERNMRGSITANNTRGGAEFRVCVPLAQTARHDQPSATDEEGEAAAKPAQ